MTLVTVRVIDRPKNCCFECVVEVCISRNALYITTVSRENLRKILGDQSNEKYIDQLIAEADFLKDGRISYGEFLHAFNQQKQALVYSIYDGGVKKEFERSLESDDAADEALRRFGIITSLRRVFNGNQNLKEKARLARDKSR